MGGKSSSSASTSNATVTSNVDRRAVLQDSAYVGDGSSSTINMTSYTSSADAEVLKTLAGSIPDAAVALGQMSATTLRDVGGAVVDLNKDSVAANSKAWDSTLQVGAETIDKLIDAMSAGYGFASTNIAASNTLAGKALEAFEPTENKNADVVKYAMYAAAAVAAAVLLKGSK